MLILARRITWGLSLLLNLNFSLSRVISGYFLKYILPCKNNFWAELVYVINSRRKGLNYIECVPESKYVRFGVPESSEEGFQMWLWRNYPRDFHLNAMRIAWVNFSDLPTISIITPVFQPKIEFLIHAIESVIAQTYPKWELCIQTDGPQCKQIMIVLKAYAKLDKRIKLGFGKKRRHISHTSNQALKRTTGDYIALLDQDDIIPPHCLYKIVKYLNKNRQTDFLYSDEAKIDENGKVCLPFFKPDWSPDYFNSIMYACHLLVFKNKLLNNLEGFREGFEGSQDWDLVLRASEISNNIGHIDDILYYWRIHDNSTSKELSNAKPYAEKTAIKALSEAIVRRNEPGTVSPAPRTTSGCYQIRYQIKKIEKISIIIPFKDQGKILDRCLFSLSKSDLNLDYEVILVDNCSEESYTSKIVNKWKAKFCSSIKLIKYSKEFNYAKIHNEVIPKTSGKYLLFLNNDTQVLTRDWLFALMEYAQKPRIGAVGAKLLYPDKIIQHAGVILGLGGAASHSHRGLSLNYPDYYNRVRLAGNFSSICAACLMCRRNVFDEVMGFDESFSHNFNDVDFCLKLLEKGYLNTYLPHVELIHYESKTRGNEQKTHEKERFQREYNLLRERWLPLILRDPYYNKHLTKDFEDFRIQHPSNYLPLYNDFGTKFI